ncbi:MAG TPA: 4-alpha-glucanotransferase, partial [Thermoanaerobaculia bacterium]|nr:4-alpha-glucanotransferase [Thermoanaerobaculia bacterium]
MRLSELRALARLHDIQLSYEDATGKRREASPDALEAILKVRMERRALSPPAPIHVVWDASIPHGYHDIDGTFVICAPRRAHPLGGRTWGLFVPLYATREDATLRDLDAWRSWVQELGGGAIATLPLLAAMPEERSPYSPDSRLFWNDRYLDTEDTQPVPAVADEELVRYAQFRERRGDGPASRHIDAQLRIAQQMRRLAARGGLYLDFPLGVHPGGYDVWRYADSFAKGVSVGAPPDAFFTKGQNWGFPPLDPDAIRANRYEYFRACIRHHMQHASILRLDHVMGLHRLYWIPEGAEAKDGVYVRYRDEELFAIIALESQLHGCAVVGEDLGTVPEYVPRAMQRHGLRRMFVVQYEAKPEGIGDPPRMSVASVNTHDMPTFAAFERGLDIDDRVEQGLLDEEGARKEREARARIREVVGSLE